MSRVVDLPAGFAPEARRILALLAASSGAMLIAAPGLARASVVRPSGAGLDPVAATSDLVAAALDAAGYVERLGAVGDVARWRIAPLGRRFLDRAPRAERAAPLKMAADRFPAGSEIRARIRAEGAEGVADLLLDLAGPDDLEILSDEWADLGLSLSAVELRLLAALVRDCGAIVSSRALYRAFVAGRPAADEEADRGLVRMALRRIREKIAAAGLPIEVRTVRGRGVAALVTAPEFALPGAAPLALAA